MRSAISALMIAATAVVWGLSPSAAYAVVARDPAAVASAYGLSGVFGPFDGRLSNAGETLRLRNHDGRVMDELTYEDQGEWSAAPDGSAVVDATVEKNGPRGRYLDGTGDWLRLFLPLQATPTRLRLSTTS